MNTTTDYSHVKPTWYAGIEFRSRLEARWAVFFDTLGINWEYEPETFISNAFEDAPPIQYTPDFRVDLAPQGHKDVCQKHFYVEIKPNIEAVYQHEKKLSMMVDYTHPLNAALVLFGPIPDPRSLPTYFPVLFWDTGVCLSYGTFYKRQFIVLPSTMEVSSGPSLPDGIKFGLTGKLPNSLIARDQDMTKALTAARNERFGLGGPRG